MQIEPFVRSEHDVFRILWEEHLTELRKMGGEILPTRRTMAYYDALFDSYVAGILPGVVLGDVNRDSILMWGASPQQYPIDVEFGRLGMAWGTYLRPALRGKKFSTQLRDEAKRRLQRSGLDGLLGSASTRNPHGLDTGLAAGFEVYCTTGVLKLRDDTDGDGDS